jgi:DNA-binding CsgD family transcriptional regulator
MNLTDRQKEILSLAASGMLAKECAHLLGLAVRTVEAHRVKAVTLLGAKNTTHAVAIAIRKGIIPVAAGAALAALLSGPELSIMSHGYREARAPAHRLTMDCLDDPLHSYPHDRRYCSK